MNRTKIVSVLLGLALWLTMPAGLLAQTQKSPISDFLNNQNGRQAWLDPATGNTLFFDAFGVFNNNFGLGLGTVFGGHVTRRELNDGSARVTVVLHTKNALCWGFTPVSNPAFGRSFAEVAGGATASLGDALTRIEFPLASAGDPLPTWSAIVLGTQGFSVTTIMCHGELRTESGFPAGTKGFAQTTQTGGLFTTGVPGGCPPETNANCFPAEKIRFKATGRK
jgi:hypothetical protein